MSSGVRSLPYAAAWGLALGAHTIIIPSVALRISYAGDLLYLWYIPSPAEAISSPTNIEWYSVILRVKHVPLGLQRTTFTAAECLLRVARYSTLGGLPGPASAPALSLTDDGMIFGWTIHNYDKDEPHIFILKPWITYYDMVVFATCGQLIGLAHEVLVLGRARLLEWKRLEVASWDRFAVVPADFQCFNTHCCRYLEVQRGVHEWREEVELLWNLANSWDGDGDFIYLFIYCTRSY